MRDDVELVLEYRRSKLPKVEERSQHMDIVAARAIIRGLIAYGWAYPELARCKSELMVCLSQFVDVKQLEHGEIQAIEAHGDKRPRERSIGATNKRRCHEMGPTELRRLSTDVESNVQGVPGTAAGPAHALIRDAPDSRVIRDVVVAENAQAGSSAFEPSRNSDENYANMSQLSPSQRHGGTSVSPDDPGVLPSTALTDLANSGVLQGTASGGTAGYSTQPPQELPHSGFATPGEAATRSPLETDQRLPTRAQQAQPYQLSPSGSGLSSADFLNATTYMDDYLSGSILNSVLMDSSSLTAVMDEYLLGGTLNILDPSSLTSVVE